MFNPKQITNSIICIGCQGCCRFRIRDSAWKPYSADLMPYKDYFICPSLDLDSNVCKIYSKRPFDCQIYPFLLHRQNAKIYLAVHLECPFIKKSINSKKLKEYISWLIDYLESDKICNFLQRHKKLIAHYPEEIRIIKELDINGDSKGLRLKREKNRR